MSPAECRKRVAHRHAGEERARRLKARAQQQAGLGSVLRSRAGGRRQPAPSKTRRTSRSCRAASRGRTWPPRVGRRRPRACSPPACLSTGSAGPGVTPPPCRARVLLSSLSPHHAARPQISSSSSSSSGGEERPRTNERTRSTKRHEQKPIRRAVLACPALQRRRRGRHEQAAAAARRRRMMRHVTVTHGVARCASRPRAKQEEQRHQSSINIIFSIPNHLSYSVRIRSHTQRHQRVLDLLRFPASAQPCVNLSSCQGGSRAHRDAKSCCRRTGQASQE